MNNIDERIEDVLSEARPRPAPNSGRKEEIYDQLRDEWMISNQQTRQRRRYFIGAAAASFIAAIVVVMRLGSGVDVPVIQPDAYVAVLNGAGATLNGEQIQDVDSTSSTLRLRAGDTIKTGTDAAVAIAWNTTGSLRLSRSSEVTIVDANEVSLKSGTIYYDSKLFGSDHGVPIVVTTSHGTIQHVGTQFLAQTDQRGTTVSVREGQVSFGRDSKTTIVRSGQSASFDNSIAATVSAIAPNDSSWDWVSEVAPKWNVDGRSTMDIIRWLSRETGLSIEFADERAEDYARNDQVRGVGEIGPTAAMRIVPVATQLRFAIDDSTIRVSIEDD